MLRSDKYELFKDRPSMAKYVAGYPDSIFPGTVYTEYGFRVDTSDYTYLLRCNPLPVDTNFCVVCYVTKWLDKHLEMAECGIPFVDASGNDLFRLPDGDEIIVTTVRGENLEYSCRYIDEKHLEVGNNIYHVNQFAELMSKNSSVYKPKLKDKTAKHQEGSDEKKNRGSSKKVR